MELPSTPPPKPSRDELVVIGLPIVRRMAYRLARRLPPNVDVGDLIGSGTEGLLKAIESFDPSRVPRFESYAEVRIRGAMLDELRAHDVMTRHGRQRMAEVTKAVRKLELDLGRSPEEEEIAKALSMTLDSYQKLAEDLSRGPALARLGEIDPDDVANDHHDASHEVQAKELRQRLVVAIKGLPDRTQTVLALYYQEECTQSEIGQILGVTESRVCQLLGDAIVRLRAGLKY